ncbi:MAG: DUF4153 domain-containing protein [Bacteroidia bacterium]|nr:DUF4153 domain-containing protein [Bacteroidia bacterium]
MKLPSIKYLFLKSQNTFIRFPFTISIAIIGTLASLYVVDFNYDGYRDYTSWYHLIMTCAIGIPMFISLTLFAERLEVTKTFKLLIRCAGFIFLFLYYITLPDLFLEKHYIRMIIWLLIFHLLVSFSPYIGFKNQYSFWQFNKILFLRLLLTILYAGVLFLGISLALLAIDQLFDINIKEEYYLRLWIVHVGIFGVWFFLAGAPKHFRKLDQTTIYPLGIKIFTQYILIPLVLIYALILYTYFIKIIITQDWPVGWVVYLVLGYAILGVLSFLLLYPIREEKQNKGIRIFSNVFFISLFPLLIMFFIAIFKRVSEYGITENRLFVILLGVWLVFNAGFIIIKKYKLIRIIPLSLTVLALFSINGPWNVFKISKWNQMNRLESVLSKNNMLKDGKIIKATNKITIDDDVVICSTLSYMVDMHGHKSIQNFFTQNLDTVFNRDTIRYYSSYEGMNKLTTYMGIEYNLSLPYVENGKTQFSYTCQYNSNESPLKVTGYDYFINYRSYYYNYENESTDTLIKTNYILSDSTKLDIILIPDKGNLQFINNDTTINIDIFAFVKNITDKKISGTNNYFQYNKEDMTLNIENTKSSYKIIFTYLSGNKIEDKLNSIQEIQADILVSTKK